MYMGIKNGASSLMCDSEHVTPPRNFDQPLAVRHELSSAACKMERAAAAAGGVINMLPTIHCTQAETITLNVNWHPRF
jgi:hypothetical protein